MYPTCFTASTTAGSTVSIQPKRTPGAKIFVMAAMDMPADIDVESLHAMSDGWVAGLVLMHSQARVGSRDNQIVSFSFQGMSEVSI